MPTLRLMVAKTFRKQSEALLFKNELLKRHLYVHMEHSVGYEYDWWHVRGYRKEEVE